jgi:tetratricopeptide (TPR) repeat protein
MKRSLGALTLALILGGVAQPALAGRLDDARNEVLSLEQQTSNLTVSFDSTATTDTDNGEAARRRLVDAQVLYNLEDYTRAAILLFDYINKYPNTRGYPEALFFLADSLFQRRDYLGAKRYFKKIADDIRGPYYQEALQRLVELSLRTGDTSWVKPYLDALNNIPRSQLKPSVPYVRGKYYYFREQNDAAIQAFQEIAPGQQYYMHAQYFIGASQVRAGQLSAALATFKALLQQEPETDGQKQIRELTHLGIGRLLYHNNEIAQAIDAYQRVDRHSSAFDEAMFEIAWAYIKAEEYERALRALDLLVLAQPESDFVPDVTVTQGNLLIRLNQWGRATNLFTDTRDKFQPIHQRMKQLMTEHDDPNVFFDALLQRNLQSGSLAVTVEVPKIALEWVREKPKVERALTLVSDVRGIQDSIDEARKLVARVEAKLLSPSRVNIFPAFASARSTALELENRLAKVLERMLALERQIIVPVLSAEEKQQLASLAGERENLEGRIGELPTGQEAFAERTKRQTARIRTLEKQLSELSVMVTDLRAQLVATEKYFADTKGATAADKRESFRRESDELRAITKALENEVEQLTAALTDARTSAGVGGSEELEERNLKERYRTLAAREHAYLTGFASRLPAGSERSQVDQIADLMQRCEQVDTNLRLFNAKLEQEVDTQLAGVREIISEEKGSITTYENDALGYSAETDQVAGALTYDGFNQVANRFRDIIVRADVGIIDVAWALKDSKSKQVAKLVRQQKLDLKMLDEDFAEVLKTK